MKCKSKSHRQKATIISSQSILRLIFHHPCCYCCVDSTSEVTTKIKRNCEISTETTTTKGFLNSDFRQQSMKEQRKRLLNSHFYLSRAWWLPTDFYYCLMWQNYLWSSLLLLPVMLSKWHYQWMIFLFLHLTEYCPSWLIYIQFTALFNVFLYLFNGAILSHAINASQVIIKKLISWVCNVNVREERNQLTYKFLLFPSTIKST